jgi:hypothetical protein
MRAGLAALAALLLALAGACKTRGTIEIAIDTPACSAPTAIVYAEPNLSCDCACGACFGAMPGGVNGCPDGVCSWPLDSIELDLAPGHWAVVVELVDDQDGVGGYRHIGSDCVEIDVDADGVASTEDPITMTIDCADCDPVP